MAGLPNRVFDDALSLPVEERIQLVETLLRSLNLPVQPDIDHAWQEEAEARQAQLNRGEVSTCDAETVMRTIREQYGQ